MIEVLKEFLLFGVIEIFILLMFYKYVGEINKVKYWHGLVLSPILLLLGFMDIPFMNQISSILVMTIYLMAVDKKEFLKIIRTVFIGFLYLLCIETIICVFYDFVLMVDLKTISSFIKFLYMIPIRIIEILLILLYKRR